MIQYWNKNNFISNKNNIKIIIIVGNISDWEKIYPINSERYYLMDISSICHHIQIIIPFIE